MKKQLWKEYFHFSRKERNALVIICTLTVLTIVVPYLMPAKRSAIAIDTALQQQLDAISQPPDSTGELKEHAAPGYQQVQKEKEIARPAKLFAFDPNTLDEEGWKRLGLRDKTIKTILNYRSKGGHFRKADDLAKVYGLHSDEAARLIPYVHIEVQQTAKPFAETKSATTTIEQKPVVQTPLPHKQYKQLNVNTATEEEWKAMPGIGDVLASRIVKFRDKIGGFKSIEQVGKTYGLKDSLFQEMKPYLKLE